MDRAKIFQSVIKGTNVFTPIIDSYHTVAIAKRRKRNKNKKTHRNAKR